ncbi:unnamed protein product [Rotaria sp. Silwood1]|nr:unnamed protein product [Rotaria sp. Silwood1]
MSTRVDLSLFQKVELIKHSKCCLSQRHLAAKYKISKGVVFNILKRKHEYLGDYESNRRNEIKRKIKNDIGKKIDDETYA